MMKIIFLASILLVLGVSNAFTPIIRPQSLQKTQLNAFDPKKTFSNVQKTLITAAAPLVIFSSALPAEANSRVVGEIQGSGIVFKDTLRVESFDDPKVKGVTLYISNFQRPVTERLNAKNLFSDPAYASVACAKTGPISVADNINTSSQGEEVFEESRSILFKSLRVQRIYDQEKNTVVYVSFNTRLSKDDDDNKSRFKSSLCAISLDEPSPASKSTPPSTASD